MDKLYNLEKINENKDKLKYCNYIKLLEKTINEVSISTHFNVKDIDNLYVIRELVINLMEYLKNE